MALAGIAGGGHVVSLPFLTGCACRVSCGRLASSNKFDQRAFLGHLCRTAWFCFGGRYALLLTQFYKKSSHLPLYQFEIDSDDFTGNTALTVETEIVPGTYTVKTLDRDGEVISTLDQLKVTTKVDAIYVVPNN